MGSWRRERAILNGAETARGRPDVPSNVPARLYQDMSGADLLDFSRSIGIKSTSTKRGERNGRKFQAYTVSGWASPEAARNAAVRLSDDEATS